MLNQQAVLFSNCLIMLFLKQLRISDNCVLVKKDLDIKDHHSIELLLISWPKEEILLIKTELEENQFMEKSSLMKTFKSNMNNHFYFQWLMQERIQMAVNFSLLSSLAHG